MVGHAAEVGQPRRKFGEKCKNRPSVSDFLWGMSRHLRFIPEGGALVEVTCRAIQGRLLLRPSPQLNEIILGVLGRAQRLYPLEIVAYVLASNHYHLVLRTETAKQLSDFMWYFNGNLAKELARETGWEDKVWSRRYQAILISEEEEAQVARLKYVLGNGVKENLVARAEEWPGVHCVTPLLTGGPVAGTWFDRTLEYTAWLRGKELAPGESASPETVHLSQLPCWAGLAPEVYRSRIADLVQEIEEAAAAAREESRIPPLGAKAILAQQPETRPKKIKKSPAPFCHALRKQVRKALWEAYGMFFAAYRVAAEKLKEGDWTAVFPPGSFPPRLPFVAV